MRIVAVLVALLAMASPAYADTPAPSFVEFEGADPAGLFTAATSSGCVPFVNTLPGGHFLDAPCQPTLRLTFTRPQASVELMVLALPVSPVAQLVAVAHRVVGDPISQTIANPAAGWNPVVLAGAGIDYVELSAPGGDIGVDHIALSEFEQPDTTIVSGPERSSSATGATFVLGTNRADHHHYTCSFDGGEWGACGPYSGLAEGAHELLAAEVDSYGARDPSPASYSWTVLGPAPETKIDSVTYTSVAFSSPDPRATFECRADDGPWAVCTSPHRFTGLALGMHTAWVRAVLDGNRKDLQPASTPFAVQSDRDGDGIPDVDDPLDPGDRRVINGETANASLVAGDVTVTLPGNKLPTVLKGVATLPVGTLVDATVGSISIHVASNRYATTDRRYRDATVVLSAGIFRIRQARAQTGVTRVVQVPVEFQLVSAAGAEAKCSRTAKGVVRTLTASGKGVFRVTGKASHADGRDAAWTTTDRCDGTLTRVGKGHAKVTKTKGRRGITVRAGHRYLVKARLFRARKGR